MDTPRKTPLKIKRDSKGMRDEAVRKAAAAVERDGLISEVPISIHSEPNPTHKVPFSQQRLTSPKLMVFLVAIGCFSIGVSIGLYLLSEG